MPASAQRISPKPIFIGVLNESPHKINAPKRHKIAETMVNIDGAFLINKNTKIGTVIHERFSKKAYCDGVVYNKPIF